MTTTTHFACLPAADGTSHPEILDWDGRLDNRDDLLARLRYWVRGDRADAALALVAYHHGGIQALRHVIGDWSMVIRDPWRRAVILASDYAGVRPLYYHVGPDRVTWSAAMDPLVEATGSDALDEEYMRAFLTLGGCQGRTPYAGIYCVPPGHAVRVTSAGATTQSFWSLPADLVIRYRDERLYDERLRQLFREAVAVRLQTEAPVVAELSGGFDSSSIVCMATELIRSGAVRARTLTTVSYVHRESIDAPFLREVETFCGVSGKHLSTSDGIPFSTAELGGALPDGWTRVHRAVPALATGLGAGTLLTGQLGDLVLGNWFDDSLQVAGTLRRGRFHQAAGEALAWSKVLRVPMTWILARASLAALPARLAPGSLFAMEGLSTPKAADTSLQAGFLARTGGNRRASFSDDWREAPPERRKHFLALTMMRELRTLRRLEPAPHLDYTHPFAHRPLVEFLMSVPPDILCRPGEPRRLMRRALADLWPPKLRHRRSKGMFSTPWADTLRPLALHLLATPTWHVVDRGWIDRASFIARLERMTHNLECNESQLRQIVLLEYWLRNRVRPRSSAVAAA